MAQKDFKSMLGGDGLLLAILNLIIGLVMLAMGEGSIGFIFYIAGILYILLGIIQFVMKEIDIKGMLIDIIIGIIVIILGIYLGIIIVGIILICSGLPAILGSSNKIASKFGMKPIETGSATFNKIITILCLVLGVCLIAGLALPALAGVASLLIRIGGLVLLVVGLIGVVGALKN